MLVMLKEKFAALVEAAKNDEDREFLLETIEDKVKAFPRYVETVYSMEVLTPIIYARYEGAEIREKVTALDESRRMAHESAIASCSCLNRLCGMMGIENLCPETDNRAIVADFVGMFVYEMYLVGTGHVNGMDDIVELMKRENMSSIPRKEVCSE